MTTLTEAQIIQNEIDIVNASQIVSDKSYALSSDRYAKQLIALNASLAKAQADLVNQGE